MNSPGIYDLLDEHILSVFYQIFDPIPVPIIMVDRETRIIFINQSFSNFLGVPREEVLGHKVLEVDRNSRFPYVLESKRAEIAWKHTFQNGQTALVHRIPVLDSKGEILFGFGLVLFQDMEEFQRVVEKNKLLETELVHYQNQLRKILGANYSWDNIIGESLRMAQAKLMGRRAAQTESTVLLLGESGTGKELFAHAIHNDSKRSHYPFVKLNCAAIPGELLESELFGYDTGAFTGARKGGKVGKFELANGGTIFLDEIGDMPLSMQAKILRVLQEREVERVGGTSTISVDVRVIAATNRNLVEMVKKHEFREDLYYRLNVMQIDIPPLRERMEDISELVDHLLRKISDRLGKYVVKVSEAAFATLQAHTWPGNVRELENVLERSINLADGEVILPAHLPQPVARKGAGHVVETREENQPIKELSAVLEDVERATIARCLEHTGGNKLQTAKLLNISRSNLYEKIQKYRLD
jgi:transcriptional regulator with PAS, ATPase and Fis domain